MNIEKFYDYFDVVANVLYEQKKLNYIEGMNHSFNYLLDQTLDVEIPEEEMEKIANARELIDPVKFQPEEIRKAVQLGILKGLKHAYMSNATMTPDTIGLFLSYLIDKLYDGKKISTILDPMIGTGNLVYTIMNQLKIEALVTGVDTDITLCRLARNFGDLLNIENQIYYQDGLSYFGDEVDLIVSDLEIAEKKSPYVPYQMINHHITSLKNDGFMLILIENDFFEQAQASIFREEVMKQANIFGIIKLSETMFSKNPKSILILEKNVNQLEKKQSDFLIVDCPSFTDKEAFSQTIDKIDQWFLARKGN